MKKFLLGLLFSVASVQVGDASVHNWVNWIDTLGYRKPAPLPVAEPNESSAPKYWVDFTSGSGTTCSQAAPCATIRAVEGKTGTLGGPAYIYIKGTGLGLSTFNDSLYGSPGAELVFKPWPAGSPGCVTECTAIVEVTAISIALERAMIGSSMGDRISTSS